MKRLCKSFSFIFLMMFCFLGFAGIGNAYCVHNYSSMTLGVNGDFCHRCYSGTLHSGDSGCCPGADAGCRGTTMIYVYFAPCPGLPALPGPTCNYFFYSPCEVTAHGDVYISGHDFTDISVTVYDDNGNLICAGPMICCTHEP